MSAVNEDFGKFVVPTVRIATRTVPTFLSI
jgi:hypothetical protein